MDRESYLQERREILNQIDTGAHYFVLMHPLEGMIIPGYGALTYTSSNTREKWVECEIVEERYSLLDVYKIELRSIEEGYGKETFYIEDSLSSLKNGYIVKKEPDMECVEVHWEEPLTPTVNLHHSAYTLKKVPQGRKK